MLTYAAFIAEYDEFGDEYKSVVERHIAKAIARVSSDEWGDLTDEGVALLAAHFLQLRKDRQAQQSAANTLSSAGVSMPVSGAVKSVQIDEEITISFAEAADSPEAGNEATLGIYSSTGYGRQFHALQRSLIIPITSSDVHLFY